MRGRALELATESAVAHLRFAGVLNLRPAKYAPMHPDRLRIHYVCTQEAAISLRQFRT